MCLYCTNFECTPGHHDLFLEPLQSKHPEVARNDPLTLHHPLFSFELEDLVKWHCSLRVPGTVAPPKVTGPRFVMASDYDT